MTEEPPKGSYTIKYVCYILYDIMHPKITSKTCQTGNFAHMLSRTMINTNWLQIQETVLSLKCSLYIKKSVDRAVVKNKSMT